MPAFHQSRERPSARDEPFEFPLAKGGYCGCRRHGWSSWRSSRRLLRDRPSRHRKNASKLWRKAIWCLPPRRLFVDGARGWGSSHSLVLRRPRLAHRAGPPTKPPSVFPLAGRATVVVERPFLARKAELPVTTWSRSASMRRQHVIAGTLILAGSAAIAVSVLLPTPGVIPRRPNRSSSPLSFSRRSRPCRSRRTS